MSKCKNPECFCNPSKRSILCKLGFHDYHDIEGHWLCIRNKCTMVDLGVGETDWEHRATIIKRRNGYG